MFQWISGLIQSGGYFGLLFLTFIENVFPPIPSELIIPFGGHLAKKGEMSFWMVVLVSSLGGTLGSLPLYYAGKILGEKRIKALADDYGAWLAVSGKDVDKAKKWFDNHRGIAVFGCRVVPGVRSFIAIPAGIARMALLPFLIYTFAGCFVWVLFLATLGWLLGDSFAKIDKVIGPLSYIILGALVAFFAFKVWKRKQKMPRKKPQRAR
ncbi:membrane protein DedA, SNARE-associated domain [Abditibacterium utsteinense]|uniref:Membrane protein DedA, SNARE-associated domain n=1 Tax=Abditibacterium utsteinense TaxID=1960156 RepID=A0A2S8SSY6_9BACT|nr:DedA family protein [Abditibacterium utsteinense]PQV63905.1 membrane protein DedA, SNARE-associated domain [Abditibacterium utsteinense]